MILEWQKFTVNDTGIKFPTSNSVWKNNSRISRELRQFNNENFLFFVTLYESLGAPLHNTPAIIGLVPESLPQISLKVNFGKCSSYKFGLEQLS